MKLMKISRFDSCPEVWYAMAIAGAFFGAFIGLMVGIAVIVGQSRIGLH